MNRAFLLLMSCLIALSGCSGAKRQGGYYKDDGPSSRVPANIQAIPDAVPRLETHRPANARPYTVMGKRYVPISDEKPFRQVGTASWYGRKFHGKTTANGETYDMHAMTAAHPTLPLPSYARVTRARTGKSIIVRINDRGPFHSSRIIDLSYVAAAKLGLIGPGSGQVIVEAITNEDIRTKSYQRQDAPAPKAAPIPAAKPPPVPVLTAQAPDDVDPTKVQDNNQVQDQNKPAPSSTPTTAVSHQASTHYFLQYGAFGTQENARRLADEINQKIAGSEPKRAQINQATGLHRVHVGPYQSRTQAVNAAIRIQDATGLKASYTESPELSERASANL